MVQDHRIHSGEQSDAHAKPHRMAAEITEKELNEKILHLLRARASCSDARSVMLYLVHDETAPDNWRIGHFDPGNGDRYKCKLALRAIAASLSGIYDMVGES